MAIARPKYLKIKHEHQLKRLKKLRKKLRFKRASEVYREVIRY